MSGKKILMVIAPLAFFTLHCSSMLTSNAPRTRIYILDPAGQEQGAGKTNAITGKVNLLVPTPQTAPGLNTDRIALVKRDGRELNYYAGARWPTGLPEMIRALMTESLRGAMAGGTVSRERSYSGMNYRLRVTVEDFQMEYGEADSASVHIQFVAYLSRTPGGELAGSFREDFRVPAKGDEMSQVIKAFEKCYRLTVASLISHIGKTVGKADSG